MTVARETTWWSNWIREDVQEIHTCAENAFADDVGVLFHEDQKGSPRWLLCSTWAATEDDVASGKAPEVGDILSATELPITFCPFCGVKLSASG